MVHVPVLVIIPVQKKGITFLLTLIFSDAGLTETKVWPIYLNIFAFLPPLNETCIKKNKV